MRLLLDSHALIWSADPDLVHRLGGVAREVIADRSNELLVSAASAWEVATKYRRGRLPEAEVVVRRWSEILGTLGARDLPITSAHGLMAGGFEAKHADPFDRMLAAQAIIEGAHLVTADPAMAHFGANLLW